MDDDDNFYDPVLYRGILEMRLDYLKKLKLLGRTVSEPEIASLEKELNPDGGNTMEDLDRAIVNADLEDLQRKLSVVDFLSQPKDQSGYAVKIELFRNGHVSLRMAPDRNHQLPHFHIEYKRQYAASYSIDPLQRIAGSMPSGYEKPMLEWARKHKSGLLASWRTLKDGKVLTHELDGDP